MDRRHATTWADEGEGANYERGRPGYPVATTDVLADVLRLAPRRRVLDVAAGTGKLTRMLLPTGAQVGAAEPAAGMRTQLREIEGVQVVAATAEHLPYASGTLDGITVAQAFHWFRIPDAPVEICRVLRPGGRLAIVRNVRDEQDPQVRKMTAILRRYEEMAPRPEPTRTWRADLDASGVVRLVERVDLVHEQRFASLDEYDARFTSISFAILLDAASRQSMVDELRAVVQDATDIRIPMRTEIEVFEAKR